MKATMTRAMRVTMSSAVLAATLMLGVGCDKKEPSKTDVPKPPAPDVTPKAANGASASGLGGATIKTPTTAPTTQAAAPTTKPAASIAGDAPLVTSTASAKHGKEAQDLLDKAMKALKDGHFDDCKAALDKVDAMGADVPKATREQATTVRKSLDTSQKLQKAPEIPAGEEVNK